MGSSVDDGLLLNDPFPNQEDENESDYDVDGDYVALEYVENKAIEPDVRSQIIYSLDIRQQARVERCERSFGLYV